MNNASIHLGTAFGIPVVLHWTVPYFLLGIAIFLGPVEAILVTVILAIVLAHEFGHSLMARRLGVQVTKISILPIGGMAHMAILPERSAEELRIAVAGPAVNLALAVPGLLVLGLTGHLGLPDEWVEGHALSVLFWFTGVNLLLGLFNLIPAFPMDGGRVLRSLLVDRLGYLRATEIAVRVGRWLAFALVAVALVAPFSSPRFLLVSMLLAGFVWLMGGRELFFVRLRHAAGLGGGDPHDPRAAILRMFQQAGFGRAGGAGGFGGQGPLGPDGGPGGPGRAGGFGDLGQAPGPEPRSAEVRDTPGEPDGVEIVGGPERPKGGFSAEDIEALERFPGRLTKRDRDDEA